MTVQGSIAVIAICLLVSIGFVSFLTAAGYWIDSGLFVFVALPGHLVAFLIGMAGIFTYPFKRKWVATICALLYLSFLLIALFFAALLTGCSFGHCL